eukprot:g54162.t1
MDTGGLRCRLSFYGPPGASLFFLDFSFQRSSLQVATPFDKLVVQDCPLLSRVGFELKDPGWGRRSFVDLNRCRELRQLLYSTSDLWRGGRWLAKPVGAPSSPAPLFMPNEGNKKTEKAEGDKNSDGHMPELQGIPTAFFARDGFNPFNHWKENKEALTEWSERVESAVDVIVEQYHKGFGTATSSFSNILSDFTNSQNLLSGLN